MFIIWVSSSFILSSGRLCFMLMVLSFLTWSSLFLGSSVIKELCSKGPHSCVCHSSTELTQPLKEFSYFLQYYFSALGFNLLASIWACYCCCGVGIYNAARVLVTGTFILASDVGWVYGRAKCKEILDKSKVRIGILSSIHVYFSA